MLCSKTPCTLSISSFPLSRHLGSRRDRCALCARSISMTIAHPAAQVAGWPAACCSGALRAITVGAENARSRVLAGPRDSGRHFVSKCSHCACSVSHERGPNARSYVKSPPPPLSLSLCPLFLFLPLSVSLIVFLSPSFFLPPLSLSLLV